MKYISVDSGKHATKVAVLNYKEVKGKEESEPVVEAHLKYFKFKTKYGIGNMLDDNLEKGTFLVSYEGMAYKIGNGARTEAELSTSKKSEIHKLCTLTAIAMCVTEPEEEVSVAIGIPVTLYQSFEQRDEYRNYILPDGLIQMVIKTGPEEAPVQVSFKIKEKLVYPESSGALYMNVNEARNMAAVIDIGNLNINCTCWDNFMIEEKYTITDELGGKIMISGLAQHLSAEFSTRVDDNVVARILKAPQENRYLKPIRSNKEIGDRSNKEIEENSKRIIKEYLLEHVDEIKRRCHTKRWPLNFLSLIFIGGTSEILKDEIREIFGEEVIIPEDTEYVNVIGFLRRLCARKKIDVMIYYNQLKKKEEQERKAG